MMQVPEHLAIVRSKRCDNYPSIYFLDNMQINCEGTSVSFGDVNSCTADTLVCEGVQVDTRYFVGNGSECFVHKVVYQLLCPIILSFFKG